VTIGRARAAFEKGRGIAVKAVRAVACLALLWLSGCAWSLVDEGRIREEPFADIVTRTAVARGDPRPDRVDARVVRKDELPALLREAVLHARSPAEMARYQTRLVAVGLWPPERDLVEESIAVARDEIAGFYVPESGVLYVVDGFPVPFSMRFLSAMLRRDLLRELVLSHEIVHLLQHRDVPSLFDATHWTDQDDATTAVQTAFEGDATRYGYAALLVGTGGSLPDPDELRAGIETELASRQSGALAEAPALLRLTLALPYSRGYPLSLAEGARLLEDPPASTEQVLHGERRRADFEVADLAPLESALPAGCESLGQNTLGELGIWVLLQDLGSAAVSAKASEGWDGDRYLAARCGEQLAFAWWTTWDSEDDAAEFADAYAAIAPAVQARAGLAATPRAVRDGKRVLVASEPMVPLLPRLADRARRARIRTLESLRAHFGLARSDVTLN
jgi:hypothetical protein